MSTDDSQDWTGRTVELEIERVAHGGHCVGRSDGRVVFVRHALPGERVRATVTEDRGGSYCRADAVEILRESAGRVAAPCRYSGPGGCGGCDWQHADLDLQRAMKGAVIAEQLERLAGIYWPVVVEEVLPAPLGWRTRMQYAADHRTVGLRAHRSSAIVEIDQCLIADPRVDTSIAREHVTDTATGVELTAGDRELVVQTIEGKRRTTHGGARQQYRVGDHDFGVRAGGFWQVHPAAPQTLTSTVRDFADVHDGDDVLDLYSGVGLFDADLADAAGPSGSVLAFEGTSSAVSDARRNLRDLPHVRSERLDIRATTLRRRLAETEFDVTVLDPPRTGAKPALCEVIAQHTRRTIVYVACDPAALARDVAAFTEQGWVMVELRAFDLFPMTHHVECVARLVRREHADGGEPARAGYPSPRMDNPPTTQRT